MVGKMMVLKEEKLLKIKILTRVIVENAGLQL
jgi:hypothetical protein